MNAEIDLILMVIGFALFLAGLFRWAIQRIGK